ncbi:MAG: phosphotransferase [Geminicoccaceae bacterium]
MVSQTKEADRQEEVIAFLSRGETFGQADQDVQRIKTHAAIIFLIGDRAYKLKRAVRYSFLDFSTLAKRRTALEAEYKLNVRTAPELYRGVFAVTRDGAGNLTLGGDGESIDWLLEMRRFDQHCLLDHLAEKGKLERRLVVSLASVVADLHRTAKVRSTGGFDAMSRVVDGNANDLETLQDILGRSHDVAGLIEATRGQLSQHHDLLDRRIRRGFVRRCHGDLHLGNIFVEDGHPVLFDCLEFDEDLASIDVLYDLAFLLMDLCRRGLQALAIDLFNAYIDGTHDDEGCALLPLFLAIRATIRAKIEGFEIETATSPDDRRKHVVEADRYLDLADTDVAP